MKSAHTCHGLLAAPKARYVAAYTAQPEMMSLGRGMRSDQTPPRYELTSLAMWKMRQRSGIDATCTPRSRARSSRNASDELPSENRVRIARYVRSDRGSRCDAVIAAGVAWADASTFGSRTVNKAMME